ncbi:hypothetical protein [Lacrimispora sp.]|jgi:hypothetical protein|uniref:hypothetical protein n=1 Tax=Lacrimispora sp. TaxID=2719234 RepID=UPI0028A5FC3E|nr:hypothetical protein [Lacrimispora sp.]
MANERNLIQYNGGLSPSEARENGRKGGKASGEARRKKADFRKTLNALLTAEIDSPEWSPVLEALGLDSTLESLINAAMIKEAAKGNVRAYEVIAKYSGQSAQTEAEDMEHEVKVKGMTLDNAAKQKVVNGEEKGGFSASIIEAYKKRREAEGKEVKEGKDGI